MATNIRRCRRALWWTAGLCLYIIIFSYRGLIVYSFLPYYNSILYDFILLVVGLSSFIYPIGIAIKYYKAPYFMAFYPLLLSLIIHYTLTSLNLHLADITSYCSYFRNERVALVEAFCSGKLQLKKGKYDREYALPKNLQYLTLSHYPVDIYCDQDRQRARFIIFGALNNGHELLYRSDDTYPKSDELPTHNPCDITRLEENWFYIVY